MENAWNESNFGKKDLKLNKWIYLIFGSYRRGEKAEENKKYFKIKSYESKAKTDDIANPDSVNALIKQVEIGINPFQIFISLNLIKKEK